MGVCVSTPLVDDEGKLTNKVMPIPKSKQIQNLANRDRISSPPSATNKRNQELNELEKMRTLSSYSANHSSKQPINGEDINFKKPGPVNRSEGESTDFAAFRPRNPYMNSAISPFMITPTAASGIKDPNFMISSPLDHNLRKTSNILGENSGDPNSIGPNSPSNSRFSHFLKLKNLSTGAAPGDANDSSAGAVSPLGDKTNHNSKDFDPNVNNIEKPHSHQHSEPKVLSPVNEENDKHNNNNNERPKGHNNFDKDFDNSQKQSSKFPKDGNQILHDKTRIFQEEKMKSHNKSLDENDLKHSQNEDIRNNPNTFKKIPSAEDNLIKSPVAADAVQNLTEKTSPRGADAIAAAAAAAGQTDKNSAENKAQGAKQIEEELEKQQLEKDPSEMTPEEIAKNKELYYRYLKKLQKEKFQKIQEWLNDTILDELSPNPVQPLHPPKNADS